jgi:hypothetical protein
MGVFVAPSFAGRNKHTSNIFGSTLRYTGRMAIEFSGEIFYWRGPSPYHFVTVPELESEDIKAVASFVSYGWGVIPVRARIGSTEWTTSLFPKNGRYLVPIRDNVRKAENLELGDRVPIQLVVIKR